MSQKELNGKKEFRNEIKLDEFKEHVGIILSDVIHKGTNCNLYGYQELIDIAFEYCKRHLICNFIAYGDEFKFRYYPDLRRFEVSIFWSDNDYCIEIAIDNHGIAYNFDFNK